MHFNSTNELDVVLKTIFQPYRNRVPNVERIVKAMIHDNIIEKEENIINDHIAFRTLGVAHLGIELLEKIFLNYGYQKKDFYSFEAKKLNAYWYAHPGKNYPRIFISELRVHELSEKAQQIIKKYTHNINSSPVDKLNFDNPAEVGAFFNSPLWELPSSEDYDYLSQESEYAAWVIYNRYYLNHYTISVHALAKPHNVLEHFNAFLESKNIVLNTAGGKIKVSGDGLLKQSSTVAEMVEATFSDGKTMLIPGSYIEFAERLLLPQYSELSEKEVTQEHRREGFETSNADKIFESTFKEQTSKNKN